MRELDNGMLAAETFEEHMEPGVVWVSDPEFDAAFDDLMEKRMTDTPPPMTPFSRLEQLLADAEAEIKHLGDEVLADAELVLHHLTHLKAAVFRAKSGTEQEAAANDTAPDTQSELSQLSGDDKPLSGDAS